MWTILLTLGLGFLIGYFKIIPPRFQSLTQWITTSGLILLLISMGASISSNPDLLNKVSQLGFQAFILALLSVAGSIILVWILEKSLFHHRKEGDNQ
ncbi:MAG: LysO family transporter [Halanaerobiales bacterium]|nr:LysO family transporter [Halanaerobiales bacterium]